MPDSSSLNHEVDLSASDAAAAAWVDRLHTGLTIEEEIALADWLHADARNEQSLRKYQAAWDRFALLARSAHPRSVSSEAAGNDERFCSAAPELAAAPGRRATTRQIYILAAAAGLAAAIACVFALRQPDVVRIEPAQTLAVQLPGLIEQRTLDDGSVIELNRGARINVQYSPLERRVVLEHGEAIFAVAKDPARPFVVVAGRTHVRAIGTAFNVRLSRDAVEVAVTEGRVLLDAVGGAAPAAPASPVHAAPLPATPTFLDAGQHAVISRHAPEPAAAVTALTPAELGALLAWRPTLLDFDDAPLSAIVAAFNERNPVRLVVSDPVIANRRMTATFRSDNVDGFVRLIEANIGVRPERLSATEIALVRRQ